MVTGGMGSLGGLSSSVVIFDADSLVRLQWLKVSKLFTRMIKLTLYTEPNRKKHEFKNSPFFYRKVLDLAWLPIPKSTTNLLLNTYTCINDFALG